MENKIKEILDILKDNIYVPLEDNREYKLLDKGDDKLLLDYITDLQEENERLKKVAHKMHLWIFLHSGDEQKVYDELGLTDEENVMLGYSGQFRIGSDEDVKD